MNGEILPNVKEQQGQAAGSWGQLQDKLWQCPHQQGVRTMVSVQGELRVSAGVNQGQTRVTWFPDMTTLTGQLHGTKSGSQVMKTKSRSADKVRISEVHGQTGHSCSIDQTRTKAEAWAKFGSQARGRSPARLVTALSPKLPAFPAAWPNVTCLRHIKQNPRVEEEAAELGGAPRALTSRSKWI